MGTLVGSKKSKFRILAKSLEPAANALKKWVLARGDRASSILHEPQAMRSAKTPQKIFRAAELKLSIDKAGDVIALAPVWDKLACDLVDWRFLLGSFAKHVVTGSELKFTEDDNVVTFRFRRGAISVRMGDEAGDEDLSMRNAPKDPAKLAATVVRTDRATPTELKKIAANKPWLPKLYISRSKGLKDLSPLSSLKHLKELDLSICHDLAGIHGVSLRELEKFSAFHARRLRDIAPLAESRALTKFSLSWTRVTNLSPIAKCQMLREVEVSCSEELDGVTDLTPLASLKRLEELALIVPAEDLAPLAGLKRLKFLELYESTASFGIVGLPAKRLISRWSDLEPLAALKNLECLDVISDRVTDWGPIEKLTKLEVVRLQGKHLTNTKPLRKMTKTKTLWFCAEALGEIEAVARMPDLEDLYLNGTSVSDLSPLARCTKLSDLTLVDTPVTDLTPLSKIKTLSSVRLSGTKVADYAPLEASVRSGTLESITVPKDAPVDACATLVKIRNARRSASELEITRK